MNKLPSEKKVTIIGFIHTWQYLLIEGTGPNPHDNFTKIEHVYDVPKKLYEEFMKRNIQ